MKRLTLADTGKTIEIEKGKLFEVSLPIGGSTGYIWEIEEIDTDILINFSVRTEKTKTKAIGVMSKKILTFQTRNIGEGKLKLLYLRPWEKTKPSKTFEITVKVI